MSLRARRQSLSPWALRPTIFAPVVRPENAREISPVLRDTEGSLLARGAGTAYGDACVDERGTHIATARLNKFIEFDAGIGEITCQAGTTVGELLDVVLPRGWFLKATPGTAFSTLGGCMACDVHGKNHHVAGSFASQVSAIELVTADGELRRCSLRENADLFWATAGGLGQTGIITKVTLSLSRVESAWIKSRHFVTRDFDETLAMIEAHADATYSVSWIDSLARGAGMGRGVVMLGEHATLADLHDLDSSKAARPFDSPAGSRLTLPIHPPPWAATAAPFRIFNALYHRRHHRLQKDPRLVSYRSFFYPLDGVRQWNRVYGRPGFLEYQVGVPLAGGDRICRHICETLSRTGNGSFLAVIKRMGPANEGPLSFPMEGYTLAIDMPARGPEQASILAGLDRAVAEAGGRVYLVKDSRLGPEWIDAMYPRRREWAAMVERYDPAHRFSSNLVRRLRLREP